VTPNRAGLEAALVALRTADPTMSLEIGTVVAEGDRVMARVTPRRAPETFLGGPLGDGAAFWSAFDLFRLRDGLIVEHWGAADDLVLVQPLVQAPLPAVPAGPLAVGVTRLTLAPGARFPTLINPGPAVFAVESGTLDVLDADTVSLSLAPAEGAAATDLEGWTPASGDHALRVGDRLVLPAGALYTLGNPGADATVVLAAVLFPLGPGAPRVDALYLPGEIGLPASSAVAALWPEGVTAEPLLRAKLRAERPTGSTILSLGRIGLGRAADVPCGVATAIELWAIAAGSGALTLNTGTAEVSSAPGEPATTVTAGADGSIGAALTVGSHGTVVLAPGSAGAWRSAVSLPLDALVLTLTDTPDAGT
jgi:hypothetical protein